MPVSCDLCPWVHPLLHPSPPPNTHTHTHTHAQWLGHVTYIVYRTLADMMQSLDKHPYNSACCVSRSVVSDAL